MNNFNRSTTKLGITLMVPIKGEGLMKFMKYGALALLCVIGLSGAAEAHHYHGWYGGGYYHHHHRFW